MGHLKDLEITLEDLGIILKDLGIILEDLGITLEDLGIILKDLGSDNGKKFLGRNPAWIWVSGVLGVSRV